jgi:hypothetical protein
LKNRFQISRIINGATLPGVAVPLKPSTTIDIDNHLEAEGVITKISIKQARLNKIVGRETPHGTPNISRANLTKVAG